MDGTWKQETRLVELCKAVGDHRLVSPKGTSADIGGLLGDRESAVACTDMQTNLLCRQGDAHMKRKVQQMGRRIQKASGSLGKR